MGRSHLLGLVVDDLVLGEVLEALDAGRAQRGLQVRHHVLRCPAHHPAGGRVQDLPAPRGRLDDGEKVLVGGETGGFDGYVVFSCLVSARPRGLAGWGGRNGQFQRRGLR
ncbi:hypothetical protein NCCP1664_29400 [Zafaria cholistanensis]|uniref:Uncharacterized protein n=1 Tax=Zafaria cholistanensis TaxID=1682741 RepID=A0A5A7NU96_9MICC|nr:hypothetical protein NCCP1664_29400 [Zafaria cholistanensis]